MSQGTVSRILTPALVVAALVGGLVAGARWHERIGSLLPDDAHTGHVAPAPGAPSQLWTCGMHPQVLEEKPGLCPICHMKLVPVDPATMGAAPAQTAAEGERRVAYWWDPMMSPPYISDRPGKSPMGMDLVPVYEDEVRSGATVVIDPVVVQNMGIRVATVREGPLSLPFRSVGFLREVEPNRRDVTLKFAAWIERLHADTEGMELRKGDPLFEVYSPDLLVAQEELLAARAARERLGAGGDDVLAAARRKLALWDVAAEDIEAIERDGKARRTILFRSPVDGFLTEKPVVEGAAVEPGTKLLRIVDQSRLWLDAQVYEEQLPYLAPGRRLDATVKALPGRTFSGEIVLILPRADPVARTVAVRIELPNPDHALRPGMYATVSGEWPLAERAVLVPREAVIDTGVRAVAFVARDRGTFEPRNVRVGVEAGEEIQVLEGLAPGETVVTSGQFLLDTESRLREAIRKMLGERLLAREAEGAPGVAAPADPALQARADAVVSAYLVLSGALAADRTDGLAALVEAVRDAAAAPEGAPEEIERLFAAVRQAAAPAATLGSAREGFAKLSDAVIALAEKVPPSTRVYVAHCPMAEASWLQPTDDVANPYYGAEMLRCGDVVRSIGALPAGHDHGRAGR